ncbi:hypothetical protein BH11MYX3_BH11MYX3_18280 [soil metagenome]
MKGAIEWTNTVRAAGSELLLRNVHPGLGLRLLRSSLERAYVELIPEVPRHIATWELLLTHARSSQATVELVPLIDSALNAPLGGDDVLFLSRAGLEIVWRDAGDMTAAQPFAAALLDIVPTHPLGVELLTLVLPELASEPVAADPVEPVAPPPVTVRIPVVAPPAKLATVKIPVLVSPAKAMTERMPVLTPPARATLPVFEAPEVTTKLPVLDPPQPSTSRPVFEPPDVTTKLPVFEAPEPTTKQPALDATRPTTRLPVFEPSVPSPSQAAPRVRPPTPADALRRDASRVPPPPRPPINGVDRAPRKLVPIDVMIELPTGGFFSSVIRDLSISGAFVLTKRTVEIGIVIAIDLKLPDPTSLKLTTLRASARVCRWTALGWGLAFIDPKPDLIAAIRRLR